MVQDDHYHMEDEEEGNDAIDDNFVEEEAATV